MAPTQKLGSLALLIGLGLLPAAAAIAGPAPPTQCNVGKGIGATSIVYFDVNGNGIWNGVAGGDASVAINVAAGASTTILGDWNDDGIDDAGTVVGTNYSIDLNGNRVWNGNAGGDRNANFAIGGAGTPLSGRWSGGASLIGKFVADTFYLDLNSNGIWNGNPTDQSSGFAAGAAPGGVPVVGDWNGDGSEDIGKYVGTFFYVDLNGNKIWNGTAGGDRVTNFAAGFGAGTPVIGDWDGDGDDEIGVFAGNSYLLDVNGNGIYNGPAGGDVNSSFAAGVAPGGTPFACDLDGDGNDDIGKVLGTTFYVDLNGNTIWDGNAGGDRSANFAIGGAGVPQMGVWE
jgi:hypothetical protein